MLGELFTSWAVDRGALLRQFKRLVDVRYQEAALTNPLYLAWRTFFVNHNVLERQQLVEAAPRPSSSGRSGAASAQQAGGGASTRARPGGAAAPAAPALPALPPPFYVTLEQDRLRAEFHRAKPCDRLAALKAPADVLPRKSFLDAPVQRRSDDGVWIQVTNDAMVLPDGQVVNQRWWRHLLVRVRP